MVGGEPFLGMDSIQEAPVLGCILALEMGGTLAPGMGGALAFEMGSASGLRMGSDPALVTKGHSE